MGVGLVLPSRILTTVGEGHILGDMCSLSIVDSVGKVPGADIPGYKVSAVPICVEIGMCICSH